MMSSEAGRPGKPLSVPSSELSITTVPGPEFVVLGGLVPELLCAASDYQHAGTTDVDVQVDLEIACGGVNTARLERALRDAEFEPDNERIWRWRADGPDSRTVVKFELLADLDDVAAGAEVHFDGCESPAWPAFCSPSAPPPGHDARPRTGTTWPSCCYTTTLADQSRLLTR